MTCALKKSSESRIRILSLINDNENATIGKEVQNCLLFEDTDERKKQKQLEQMFKEHSKNDFLKNIGKILDNYYIISYKLKER